MSDLFVDLGFLPTHQYSLLFPLASLVLWLLCFPIAYFRKVRIFYVASLKAAFFEEGMFRGLIYGGVLYYTKNVIYAVLASSFFFGIFHMRNLWWATWRRSWAMTMYAGLTAGPLLALVRFLTGDIYLGILIHFVHNFIIIMMPRLMGRGTARTPTDDEMRKAHLDRRAKVGR